MKKANIYVLAFLLALLPAGCAHELEEPAPAVPQVFTGVIEQGVVTKTELGPLDEGVHRVKWSVGDEVLIGLERFYVESTSSDGLTATFKAVNPNAVPIQQVNSELSVYYPDGIIGGGGYYAAWYPPAILDTTTSPAAHRFTLPYTQYYKEDRIDNLPMCAISRTGDSFKFRNLCAVLAISLTGPSSSYYTVGKIGLTHTSNNRPSGYSLFGTGTGTGYFKFDRENPKFSLFGTGDYSSVALDCKKNTSNNGVTLDPATPKTFYIAIPPGTYYENSLKISVHKINGQELKSFTSKKQVDLERNHIYPISLTLNP